MPKPRVTKPGAEKGPFRPDRIVTYTVPAEGGPRQLLEFLLQSMSDRKRTTVKDFLKHNQVMVGRTVTRQWDQELQPGDTVAVNLTREFQTFKNSRLSIVYEDDDIIVVNKGYGLLSMGTDRKHEGTAYWLLRDYVKRQNPRNKLFIVHRLDQQTSGLMVFARTMQAKEGLQHNWNNMVLDRRYVAVVEGAPDPEEGEVRSYLAENQAHEVYSTERPDEGKLAVTRYKTLRGRGKYTLVELSLETGRKNQIRVHMHDLGCPISGDRRYGGSVSPIHRLALHARTLRFIHPVTKRDMHFTTPIPAAFQSLL